MHFTSSKGDRCRYSVDNLGSDFAVLPFSSDFAPLPFYLQATANELPSDTGDQVDKLQRGFCPSLMRQLLLLR